MLPSDHCGDHARGLTVCPRRARICRRRLPRGVVTPILSVPHLAAAIQTESGPVLVQRTDIPEPEQLARELQEALLHLYDPAYRPSDSFCRALGCSPERGVLPVQSAIVEAIARLEPPPGTPATARPREIYDLLYSRYVAKMTQEQAAERLTMSVSALKRLQREAVHLLARELWERTAATTAPAAEARGAPAAAEMAALQAEDWQTQLEREMAALEADAAYALADVGEVLRDVLELQAAWGLGTDVAVQLGHVQPGLKACLLYTSPSPRDS